MKTNYQPVQVTDTSLSFTRHNRWDFAAGEKICGVALGEVELLAKEYVIVFSSDKDAPSSVVVLLGVDGRNAYTDTSGNWNAQVIPAVFRLYPFHLISGKKSDEFIVAYDANAPHFQYDDGETLFGSDKKPTDFLNQVTAELINVHRSFLEGQALVKQLEDAGLIEERRIDIQLIDGSYRSFAGFKAINEEKLIGLDPEVQKKLRASGAEKLLALHRASLSNFARLIKLPPTQ